jgi:cytochrome c oxidase cbb3-type subunit 3
MSSPCPKNRRRARAASLTLAALALAGLTLAAWDARQQGRAQTQPPTDSSPLSVPVTSLVPGGGPLPPEDPHVKIYEGNPRYIAEGKRLFEWYNCVGCHFHGAGGMGPALMDKVWIYGGRLDQIYASIYQGRPNGMPTWGGKIPDAQIWEIAAYVRSLSTTAPQQEGATQAVSNPSPAPQGVPQPPDGPAGQQGGQPDAQSPPKAAAPDGNSPDGNSPEGNSPDGTAQ